MAHQLAIPPGWEHGNCCKGSFGTVAGRLSVESRKLEMLIVVEAAVLNPQVVDA